MILIGCDFDGNDQADLTYIREGVLYHRNFSDTEALSFEIGTEAYQDLHCADTTGDGIDEVIKLVKETQTIKVKKKKKKKKKNKKKKRKRASYKVYVIDAKGTTLVAGDAFGHRKKDGLIAADINNDGTQEYGYYRDALLVFKLGSQVLRYNVHTLDASEVQIRVGLLPTAAGALYPGLTYKARKERFYEVNFIDLVHNQVDLSEANADETVTLLSDDYYYSTNASGGGTIGNPPGEGLSAVCAKVEKIHHGILWKPESDVSDSRGGKPVVLFVGKDRFKDDRIRIFASNGTQVATFGFKAPNHAGVNNGARHYYSGWGDGDGKNGHQIAAAAKAASGSSNVFFQSKNGCTGPVNPAGRSGGI